MVICKELWLFSNCIIIAVITCKELWLFSNCIVIAVITCKELWLFSNCIVIAVITCKELYSPFIMHVWSYTINVHIKLRAAFFM